MLFPLLILAEPKKVFSRIESLAAWFAPLAYCAFGFFVITWLGGCWENISDGLRWWSLLGPAIAAPLIIGATGFGSTAVLYLANRITSLQASNPSTYRSLLSLNLHCMIILILGEMINFLLVRTALLHDNNFPLANRFPLGLDLLLLGAKEPNMYLTIFLHGTSIFIIWYLIVLAKGLSYVTGSSLARSVAIASILWLVGVVFVVGVVYSAGEGTVFRVMM